MLGPIAAIGGTCDQQGRLLMVLVAVPPAPAGGGAAANQRNGQNHAHRRGINIIQPRSHGQARQAARSSACSTVCQGGAVAPNHTHLCSRSYSDIDALYDRRWNVWMRVGSVPKQSVPNPAT